MIVKAVTWGPVRASGYLAFAAPGGAGIVIDAPPGATPRYLALAEANDLHIQMIVNTHGHWDHVADNAALIEATNAPLYAHSWDAVRMANPHLTMFNNEGFKVAPSHAKRSLRDGETLEVGALSLEVIHTPGHTPGSVCFHERKHGALFSGDTLLRQGVGSTSAPGGDGDALKRSLLKLCPLPDFTRVYPGHGSVTTIKVERWLLELALLDDVVGSR